jgi:glycosyltransferase involved in cell wall biosynthesis
MNSPRPCLSVAVPCFDEADTVAALVVRVLASPWTAQVIVVDDGSTDSTAKVLADLVAELGDPRLDVVTHEHNRGKGASLRSAFARVTGEYVVVQDADLEYDPREYDVLLEPLERGVADVVFGSRFLSGRPHRVLYFWHSLGNRVLTLLSNMFTDLNLTDMESCYKCFRREVVEAITIREDRFGVEPELTAKVAGGGWRIYEVGISYSGRTYAEGKKIGWRDGMWAAACVVRYSPVLRRIGRGFLPHAFRSHV